MATKNLWRGSARHCQCLAGHRSSFQMHLLKHCLVQLNILAICTSERWRVHVLDVHHNLDRAVRYYPISCSVMPAPDLKWAAGGPHPPCPHSPPPTPQALCLEGMGVFAFGQRPLVWSSPSPDVFPSRLDLCWLLRWPAAGPGRGQADPLSALRHHLSTRHCTCKEKEKIVSSFFQKLNHFLENCSNNILTSSIKFLCLT